MSSVFLSYRRDDSAVITGRIYDRFTAAYGKPRVFKDVDNIPPGVDFRAVLQQNIARCRVVLVVIGPQWAQIAYANGQPRLFDPNDFVRIEIESALARANAIVVPLLVMGAAMPSPQQLPPSLHPLVYRNAVQIRNDPDFHRDMTGLLHDLSPYLGKPRMPGQKRSGLPWVWFGALGVMAVVGLVAALLLINALGARSTGGGLPTGEAAAVNTPADSAGVSQDNSGSGSSSSGSGAVSEFTGSNAVFGVVTFEYPQDWAVLDVFSTDGAVAVGTSRALLNSVQTLDIATIPAGQAAYALTLLPYDLAAQNFGTVPPARDLLETTLALSGGFGFSSVRTVTIGDYSAARVSGSSVGGDLLMLVVELDEAYAVVVAATASGELSAFEDRFNAITASIRYRG